MNEDQSRQVRLNKMANLITDADFDLNTQINVVENMALRDLDGLLVVPVSAEGMVSTIEKIWEESGKELPIISINTVLDPPEIDALVAHVGPNYLDEAEDAVDAMLAYMESNDIDSDIDELNELETYIENMIVERRNDFDYVKNQMNETLQIVFNKLKYDYVSIVDIFVEIAENLGIFIYEDSELLIGEDI